MSYYEQVPSYPPNPAAAAPPVQRSAAAVLSGVFAAAIAVFGFFTAIFSVLAPRVMSTLGADFSTVSMLFGLFGIVSALLGIGAVVAGIVALVRDRTARNLGWAAAGTAVGGAVVLSAFASLVSSVFNSL